jgi:hypothetical protein
MHGFVRLTEETGSTSTFCFCQQFFEEAKHKQCWGALSCSLSPFSLSPVGKEFPNTKSDMLGSRYFAKINKFSEYILMGISLCGGSFSQYLGLLLEQLGQQHLNYF